MSDPHPAGGAELKQGDRVLVRYGRHAGRVGVVEVVFRHERAGREFELVWVRFEDRTVDGFNPKHLMKEGGKK